MQKTLGEVHVLSVKQNYAERDTDYFNTVTIHRCLPPVLLTKTDILPLLVTKPLRALQTFLIKIASVIKKRLHGQEQICRKNIEAVLTRKLRELENENYDVIIPICGYYEAATVAMKSKWPMVLYQVDPCATNVAFTKNNSKRAKELERKLYEQAVAIITTPLLYQDIRDHYPRQIAEKAYPMEFPNVSAEDIRTTQEHHQKITCLFAGSIYPAARNPRYTIDLFNRMQDPRTRLVFAGCTRESVSQQLSGLKIGANISFLGLLPLEKARMELANAEVLVNIGNIMTNQVPSKIFEYISHGKPIINICVNQNCPSIPYLEKYPLALSIVEGVGTPEEHAAEIEKFILENAGRTVDKAVILERYKECTAEYCANQMADILNNVICQ